MRRSFAFRAATAALFMTLAGSSAALADIFLPTDNCGLAATNNCIVFDDFTVYSLALLNAQQGYGGIGNGDPYLVVTNGNALRDALVVGTGAGGTALINSDVITNGGVDGAYNFPSAAGGGVTNFQSTSSNDTTAGSAIAAPNSTSTWDVNTADLIGYLAGGDLAFFFNLNQQNSDNTYLTTGQDALGWLSVTLTDTSGTHTPVGQHSITFWLDGNACDGNLGGDPTHCASVQSYAQTNANNSILPSDADHDEWAYIHGQICMDPAGAVAHFGACDGSEGTGYSTINQNLGEKIASFALYSQALQAALMSGDYDKMSVDMRMAALTNGYENLLIFSALHIPEPLTVALFGTGLLGLTVLRRRRKQARA